MFGSPETTPGGRALRFYASVRLDIRRIETLKEGVEAIGNRVRVKVVKNKVAPPFKQAEFDIIYGDGISWEGTVLEAGLERKVVQKSGSYFSFGDERLGQGRQNATAFLKEHPDVVQAILQAIQAQAPGTGHLGPPAAASGEPTEVTPVLDDEEDARAEPTAEPRPRNDRPCQHRHRLCRDPDPIELAARALRHRDRSRHELDERLARAGVDDAERAEALDDPRAGRLRRRRPLRRRAG